MHFRTYCYHHKIPNRNNTRRRLFQRLTVQFKSSFLIANEFNVHNILFFTAKQQDGYIMCGSADAHAQPT